MMQQAVSITLCTLLCLAGDSVYALELEDECHDGSCSVTLLQRAALGTEALSMQKLKAMKLKTVADIRTEGDVKALSGSVAPLNHKGYVAVALLRNNTEMEAFIRRVVTSIGGLITDEGKLHGLSPFYSGETVVQTYHRLLKEMREKTWVKLPPPQAGSILFQMIRADPWDCNLLSKSDIRKLSCALAVDSPELNPQMVRCEPGKCTHEHANAFRTNFLIGSLPCCPTGPFCAAPACKPVDADYDPKKVVCTKRETEENLAYLRRHDVWPAYHGFGGSFEMDSLKLIDALGCRDNSTGDCPETPFDMVLDLGANSGYFTEKLSTRHFAKDYIMIEAQSLIADEIKNRWLNNTWKQNWFAEQVPPHSFHKSLAQVEVLHYVLSNASEGNINMCKTESSFESSPEGCISAINTVDRVIPHGLSPKFKARFASAESLFVKVDTAGMDELVLRGMTSLLDEIRGQYLDSSPKFLVNFLQFEFSPTLMEAARRRGKYTQYNIKTVTEYLESKGFESFLIGPRYLPLSHGSWDDRYMEITDDAENNAGVRTHYPNFDDRLCPGCEDMTAPSFTSDVFAMRASHPRANEIRRALGACKESQDFHLTDHQYLF